MDFLTYKFENKKFCDAIYFDIKKAFDSVNHNLLLRKLETIGITGKFLNWIKSFICNRNARVCINKSYSSYFNINAGVPQGSVLGPILFIFFISDLPKFCQTDDVFCGLFADDVKAASSIPEQLQIFINKITEWCRHNLLEIAIEKCNVIHFNPSNPQTNYYYADREILPHPGPIRDLGIYLSPDFSFSPHISIIIGKAKRKLYLLLKSLQTTDPMTLAQLYGVYVRPHLEFCSPVFNPPTKKLSDEMERVQRLATRLICKRKPNLFVDSYEDRLSALNLTSLKDRRTTADLSLFQKIFLNLAEIDHTLPGYPRLQKSLPRHEGTRFVTPICTQVKVRGNSFLIRAANTFNNLPKKLKLKLQQKNFKELVLENLLGNKF